MGLVDEVNIVTAELPPPHHNKKKWVRETLGSESKELDKLLADSAVPPRAIWMALKKRDLEIGLGTITRWAKESRE